jgi:hypothetical protein
MKVAMLPVELIYEILLDVVDTDVNKYVEFLPYLLKINKRRTKRTLFGSYLSGFVFKLCDSKTRNELEQTEKIHIHMYSHKSSGNLICKLHGHRLNIVVSSALYNIYLTYLLTHKEAKLYTNYSTITLETQKTEYKMRNKEVR